MMTETQNETEFISFIFCQVTVNGK